MKNIPELIAPAGDWCSLLTAIENGADSVYFGIKGINMRYRATNFKLSELNKVMKILHKKRKKGYLVLNTIIYNNEIKKIETILKKAKIAKVDAVILWDMAVLEIAKKLGLRIHLSTQASVSNFNALKHYAKQGVKRVVLARETSLSDIKDIVKKIKTSHLGCDVETFIHGSMCVSLSGRCFLSHEAFKESANRGKCLQPCRRKYLIKDMEEKDKEYILGEDYILSPRDLCTIDFIEKLIESGISAFKIEGRIRAPEYVKEVTSVYREAIDLYFKKDLSRNKKKSLKNRLTKVFNRGFTDGFYYNRPKDTGARRKPRNNKIFLGDVVNFYRDISVAAIRVCNDKVKVGEEVLIYGETTPARTVKIEDIHINRKSVRSAKKGDEIGIKLPFKVRRNDKVFIYKISQIK
ncbi:MAG: U32 family peptidase [Candidatus Omnitrophota bacterium]